MGELPLLPLSEIHEGYLAALAVICVLQFLFYLSRRRAYQKEISSLKTEQSALQQELMRLQQDHESMELEAKYDTLTGLPNRGHFQEKLSLKLDDVRTQQTDCALLMIDVDRFKAINDNFGHQAGDDVLKQLASQLQDFLSHHALLSQALCARFGGDEFSVLLPGLDAGEASRVAEQVRTGTEALHLEFKGRRCPLTISIGVASFPAHTSEPDLLIELADQALYRAKADGRNRVCAAYGHSRQQEENDVGA